MFTLRHEGLTLSLEGFTLSLEGFTLSLEGPPLLRSNRLLPFIRSTDAARKKLSLDPLPVVETPFHLHRLLSIGAVQ